ncbi:MAG: aminoacyl-histidine dipeptidase [Bacteroidales bacterium]|jgi:dipeptidase D|nr:aminoacyl-histidine dipeptidase [Bacteroidales bacterium]
MSIQELEPKVVWKNFYALTQLPRPSYHEEKVVDHLYNWGIAHGFETIKDSKGPIANVIVRVPATPGMENRKGVILQGHMDMVPQKTSDSGHDFLKDPISAYVDGEWVTADRTTLGADNGIGLSLAMAAAEDPSVQHGPLELLATYTEETGMDGANSLAPGLLKGDILLNLDSEEEGELCVGCAGGLDVKASFKFRKNNTPEGSKGLKVTVKGLQGGHSGMDISLYRANANKVMARMLLPMMEMFGVKIVSFTGGSLRNAIPFEAETELVLPEENVDAVIKGIENSFAQIQAEFAESDPSAKLIVEKVPAAPKYIQNSVMLRAVKALLACPSNVIRMSRTMEGLTETSINMAIVRTEKGNITITSLMRSAVDSAKAALAQRVRCIFELAGADKIEFKGGYSGWTPRLGTEINKVCMEQYQKVYGRPMKIMATHGGLECAIMGAKYPNWEMVSIGPTIKYPHSPDEKVNIASVARTWEYLKAVLANIPVK